jgi:ABC-type sugar transport system ATPase subunit
VATVRTRDEGNPRLESTGLAPDQHEGLIAEHVSKSFGATRALQDFSYRFLPGRVYALVGENGSGKSTLIKMLSGAMASDRGSINVSSTAIRRARPRTAISAGVATCLQEIMVEGNLTTLQNLFLWDRGWVRPHTPVAQRREIAERVLNELSLNPPPLDAKVDHLSLAARQLVVIARTMVQEQARVLLFDEVTSALDQADSERVLDAIGRRSTAGATVIFTSHRMDELQRIGQEIIVLRNGVVAGVLSEAELTEGRMLELMSGRPVVEDAQGEEQIVEPPSAGAERTRGSGAAGLGSIGERAGNVALRVGGVKLLAAAEPVDLDVNWGEITGFAGLDGHGQAELLRLMGGVARPRVGTVEVSIDGDRFTRITGQRQAVKLGVSYLPRDRKTQGIFATLSVLDNFGLATIAGRTHLGFESRREKVAAYDPLAQRLAVRTASRDAGISSLSGGNQQKVLVARWLAANPRVMLLDDPTRGVDIGTKFDLYGLLRELAAEGRAVVIVSTELEELATVCDRVVVIHDAQIAGDLRRPRDGVIHRNDILGPMLGRVEAA